MTLGKALKLSGPHLYNTSPNGYLAEMASAFNDVVPDVSGAQYMEP